MFVGVDLGSTNLKVALYNSQLECIRQQSSPVAYIRENAVVEFDAQVYVQQLLDLLQQVCQGQPIDQIAFTGQAESLVVLDKQGQPLMNVISWMDERSAGECETLSQLFPDALCREITGQPAVLPTWPATKILWLKNNRPELFAKAGQFMLLKDYIVYCLTRVALADMSIATFSFYFDIYNKCYWQEMLDAIGITQHQLPPLCEPCTVAGPLTDDLCARLGFSAAPMINVGTLDHFAGMIATGNITPGGITLSTGTVMALATMSCEPAPKDSGIAMHYGFIPDTHVMLPVAESGGVSLEWFHRSCMPGISYDEMNRVLSQRPESNLLFLPYLVGTNAPEFDSQATGVFWGLRQEHDAIDMAGAVMEGVSFVLRKNCDQIRENGIPLTAIIATGGGAKSPVWCQMQADCTGLPVYIPAQKEAACLGAAMIAAVGHGTFSDFSQAAKQCVSFCAQYTPRKNTALERKYRQFCKLYRASLEIAQTE